MPDRRRPKQTGPAAEGERREWGSLPSEIRSALEARLGAVVAAARSEPGGFSPGVAARLRLADGRRIFAKVVSRSANPDSPDVHRAEARVLPQLPADAPVARLLGSYDDGEWVALFLEEIEGHIPPLPWRRDDLARVVRAMEALADQLTPSPFAADPLADRHGRTLHRWRELREARDRGADALSDLDPWIPDHLGELVALEDRFGEASAGTTLVHGDLRADNILLTRDGVRFVDWPAASVGAAWFDLAAMAPSVAMQGGPRPWTVFDRSRLSRPARPEDVDAVVAALAGYFVVSARKPPVPGLSTLRPFQRAQGIEAYAWLRRRLGR
jgi:aminoglycoside phosphotransferase (APT) family kinase protein